MKYAIVILGGAADEPQPDLGGQTPLQAAKTPTLDGLAEVGRLGQVAFLPADLPSTVPPSAETALRSLLGYPPTPYAPGHAPLHALGMGLPLGETCWAFNLSLLSVVEGTVQPHAGLTIPGPEAHALIRSLLGPLGLAPDAVCPGGAVAPGPPTYLWIAPASPDNAWAEVVTQQPEDIAGLPLRKALPVGGPAGRQLHEMIVQSQAHLVDHELNLARAEMGEPPVTHLWPWGQGTLTPQLGTDSPMRPWADRYGVAGAFLSPDPALCGLAQRAGIHTDLISPDDPAPQLAAIAAQAADALDRHDLVIAHTPLPRNAALTAGPADKARAIELAEQHLLQPLYAALSSQPGPHRFMVTPMHATGLRQQREELLPVPFLMAGEKITMIVPRPMTEPAAEQADLRVEFGHELMDFFLRGGIR